MTETCFFDTNVMIYDFLSADRIETYNTENDSIIPVISLYVKEEFLHKAAAHQIYKGQYDASFTDFNDLWERFEYYTANYRIARPSMSKIDRRFNQLLNNLRIALDDFEAEYGSTIPGGKDIIHLATADTFGCDSIVTSDSQFRGLEDHDIGLKQLDTVIYIDQETLKVEERINIG